MEEARLYALLRIRYPSVEGSKPYITTGLVTGRALNEEMRGDYWDGTLQEAEVENVIIPPPSGGTDPSPYADEVWDDLRVRCYNHIYGDDLLILTTKLPDPGDQTAGPLADFGEDGTSGDLNHNLSDVDLDFTNNDDGHGNSWQVDTDGYYVDPGTWSTFDTTKFSAKANIGPVYITQVDLILEGYVVDNDSSITFTPRLDNRPQQDVPPYTRTGNFPGDDGDGNHDTLGFYIDGEEKWSTYNEDFDTEEQFLTFRDPVTVDGIAAGKRTFRWTLKRFTDNQNMAAWLDDIQLPSMLTTDDINGVKRWFQAGGKIRRAKWWSYPKRDNDEGLDLNSRVSTVPDFITKDKQGRILYGNPHYVVRVIVEGIDDEANPDGVLDETFADKGYLRFTASPAIAPPAQYQNDNCEWVDAPNSPFDAIIDPKGFQILPFGDNGDFQLRGVNAAIRDATEDPLNLELYQNETFSYLLNAGSWNTRASSWTISDDGKTAVPHLEVLWRPLYDQVAYPVGPDFATYPDTDGYQTPPFPGQMQADSSVLETNETLRQAFDSFGLTQAGILTCRVRDPNKDFEDKTTGDPNTRKPVWTGLSYVVQRIYGDTYSLRPQFVWARPWSTLLPDPVTGDDPGYNVFPYPSVQWSLVTARHCPSADHIGYTLVQPSLHLCPNSDLTDPDDWHYTWSLHGIASGFTDFDVVDEDCDCGCSDAAPVEPTDEVRKPKIVPPPKPGCCGGPKGPIRPS